MSLITKSAKILPSIELISNTNSQSTYKLRRNFIPIETIDQLTNRRQIEFQFEEVEITMNTKTNNQASIEQNFDSWFAKGVKRENLEKEIAAKQKEMDKLINDYEQLNLNTQLKSSNLTAFQSIGSLYTENLKLKTENTKLKTQNLNSMMAIAELYTLLGGQTNG